MKVKREIKFVDRWEVRVKPSVADKLSDRGLAALKQRLKDRAGRYSLEQFKTEANALDWLASLPDGLRTRCEVAEVMFYVF